jgi:hypothetical protein
LERTEANFRPTYTTRPIRARDLEGVATTPSGIIGQGIPDYSTNSWVLSREIWLGWNTIPGARKILGGIGCPTLVLMLT